MSRLISMSINKRAIGKDRGWIRIRNNKKEGKISRNYNQEIKSYKKLRAKGITRIHSIKVSAMKREKV